MLAFQLVFMCESRHAVFTHEFRINTLVLLCDLNMCLYIVNTTGIQAEDMGFFHMTIQLVSVCEVRHTVITFEFGIQALVCVTLLMCLYIVYSEHIWNL